VRGNASTAGAQALTRGLDNLGNAFLKVEATFRQRDEQTDRFASLRRLSEMQTRAGEQLTELKRQYDPSGKGFVEAANKVFGSLEQEYLQNVPPDLHEEFNYRTQTIRQSVLGDALQFQYESGDAWFKQGVADELDKARVILDQNPAALEAQQSHIVEIINATDLPEAVKDDLARQASISLAAVTYKAEVRRDPSLRSAVGVGTAASIVDKIIGVESAGDPGAKNPRSSASGLGQFTDSTWLATLDQHRPDLAGLSREEKLALKSDPVIGRQMTEAHTQDNINALASSGLPTNEGAVYLAHFAGIGGAKRLLRAEDSRPVIQVLGPEAVEANPFLRGKTVGWIKSWANQKMGGAKLATDPRFEIIPYEDRIALSEDAEREASALAVEQAAQAKAQREASQNALYLGLLDGNKGRMDIDNARAGGVLDDYDSVNKALNILKERNADLLMAQGGYEKLASGNAWDPTSTDDKKMLNAVVKQGNGLMRLNSGDREYVTQGLVPLVNQTGDIPTDAAGTLMGMVRGGDNQRMLYALDALAQLRDANPIAFNQRVNEDVARQVDLWDARKDITPQDELASMLRGGTTQSERQMREVLRAEAKDLLGRKEGGLKTLAAGVISDFGGYTWNPATPPLVQQAFEKEFQTLFIDEYSKTGSEEIAAANAKKALERTWGVTSVGTGRTLMKYPPEKVGYRAINGSHDWINMAVKEDFKLAEGETFDLFSDEQTLQEFQKFQGDPSAPPPSYRAFIKDENGVYRERTDENGLPLRANFEPPAALLEEEQRNFDLREELFFVDETIDNYYRLLRGSQVNPLKPQEIPEEDRQAYEAAVKRKSELRELMSLPEDEPVGEPHGLGAP
jgi:hypothetical protein